MVRIRELAEKECLVKLVADVVVYIMVEVVENMIVRMDCLVMKEVDIGIVVGNMERVR